MATYRSFESFTIVWDRGSSWSNYDRAQAEATVAHAATRGEFGRVVRKVWEVEVTDANRGLLQAGCGDREVTA